MAYVAHLKKVKLSTVCWERLSSFIQTLQILQLTSQATTASFRSLSTTPSRLASSLPNRHENCIISGITSPSIGQNMQQHRNFRK